MNVKGALFGGEPAGTGKGEWWWGGEYGHSALYVWK
jgi:hypothetical protein